MKVIITRLEMKKSKTGNIYYTFEIKTEDNQIHKAVMFDSDVLENDERCFSINAEVNLLDYTYNHKYNNYQIKRMEFLNQKKSKLSNDEVHSYYSTILELYNHPAWNTTQDRKKMKNFFEGMWRLEQNIKASPAAISHHHNFEGGLLQHTIEMLYLYFYNYEFFKPTDPFEMITSITMHDVFKIYEYGWEGNQIIYNNFKHLIGGHIFLGSACAYFSGLINVAYNLASHHGQKEHGAIVEPETYEANLLFVLDMLSSRLGDTTIVDFRNAVNVNKVLQMGNSLLDKYIEQQ